MDLPIISKFDNFSPSIFGVKMFFQSTFGKPKACGRIKSRYPKAVRRNDSKISKPDSQRMIAELHFTKDEALARLKECEITGCGGAGYPTYKKLEALSEYSGEKHLIINAAECDIGLIHDGLISDYFFNEIDAAAYMIKEAFDIKDITLVSCDEGKEESYTLKSKTVVQAYPVGAERILINELTGVVIPQSERPTDYGFVVLNVQTLLTIYNALVWSKPFTGKYITVANMDRKNAYPVFVPFGSNISEIAREYFGDKPEDATLYAGGGAMKAHPVAPGEVTDRSVSFIAYGKPYEEKETVECMYCGACLRACPMDIKVNRLAEHILEGRFDIADKMHPERCIGCNSCTYTCFIGRTNSRIILEYNLRKQQNK